MTSRNDPRDYSRNNDYNYDRYSGREVAVEERIQRIPYSEVNRIREQALGVQSNDDGSARGPVRRGVDTFSYAGSGRRDDHMIGINDVGDDDRIVEVRRHRRYIESPDPIRDDHIIRYDERNERYPYDREYDGRRPYDDYYYDDQEFDEERHRRNRHHRRHRKSDKSEKEENPEKHHKQKEVFNALLRTEDKIEEKLQPPGGWRSYADTSKTGLAVAVTGGIIGGALTAKYTDDPNKRAKQLLGTFTGAVLANVVENRMRNAAHKTKEKVEEKVDEVVDVAKDETRAVKDRVDVGRDRVDAAKDDFEMSFVPDGNGTRVRMRDNTRDRRDREYDDYRRRRDDRYGYGY